MLDHATKSKPFRATLYLHAHCNGCLGRIQQLLDVLHTMFLTHQSCHPERFLPLEDPSASLQIKINDAADVIPMKYSRKKRKSFHVPP